MPLNYILNETNAGISEPQVAEYGNLTLFFLTLRIFINTLKIL